MGYAQKKEEKEYLGFEQGPIRPPSEAYSLLIRVTRNCPWNHCTFCPVYKGDRFSLRPPEHVKKDIDAVREFVDMLRQISADKGYITREELQAIMSTTEGKKLPTFHAAVNWMNGGMKSIFIQDANSLIIKPEDLVDILNHLKTSFPWIERITSYARSQTISKIRDNDLREIKSAGLNRIHIGLESGSDTVLKLVRKGATKELHIKAGTKVKNAGMELSEYVMPGLGGRAYSHEHALETADALNRINPDFIRLRTLAIPNHVPLFEDWENGNFEKCTDLMMSKEILTFIEHFDGITSTVKSDHILNLFQEVEGKLPEDKEKMMTVLKTFIDLPKEEQMLYQVGRRLSIFYSLSDMDHLEKRMQVEEVCRRNNITPENSDEIIEEIMKRFI